MNDNRTGRSLSGTQKWCYALLWHPLYTKEVPEFVRIAGDHTLVAVTIRAISYACGYGFLVGCGFGAVMLYARGFVQLPTFISVLAALCVVLVICARGMAKVRADINRRANENKGVNQGQSTK